MHARLVVGLGICLVFANLAGGCRTRSVFPPPAAGTGLETRNNCCSLLHQLLEQEKDVSVLRFIKKEHTDVKELVKRIANTSGIGADLLEAWAQHDGRLRLDDLRLPAGEVATRDAIAKDKRNDLLGHHGDDFELSLLLAQAEALSYGWHLALVASRNEPDPDRARALEGMAHDDEKLYREVFTLILARTQTPAAAAARS